MVKWLETTKKKGGQSYETIFKPTFDNAVFAALPTETAQKEGDLQVTDEMKGVIGKSANYTVDDARREVPAAK